MKFDILSEELREAASELACFGIETGEGIPVECAEGDFKIACDGAKIVISVRKRVEFFYALKLLADEGLPEAGRPLCPVSRFDDLTYMLDCSRNAVPKEETLKELIRHLAVLGYDSLGLYMEDTFLVKEYPYFGYLRTPFRKEDIRAADEYCKRFGIELVPYIQTLAHFNTLTRHYAMEGLFDTGDILLCGSEETYRFLDALVSACAEYFTSRNINIGMDEAYMLGRGRYLDGNGYRPRFRIMAEHLERVVKICEKYGFAAPMMWSDMFFSQAMSAQYGGDLPAGVAESLPSNVELIYWDYCSVDEKHYAAMMKKHRVFANPVGFAGGAWKWLGYTPDNRYALASCRAAAKACISSGIRRFVVTGWGDNGAECSVFSTLPALLACSRYRYGKFAVDGEFRRSFERLAGMKYERFMAIDLCNRVTKNRCVEEKNSANKYLLFNDVLLGTLDTTVYDGLGELYASHARKLSAAKRVAGRWEYLFETQYRLARVLAIKADMGIKLRKAYRAHDLPALAELAKKLALLSKEIELFYAALLAQWERENRANGFDVQDIRVGALKQRVLSARRKLKAFLETGAPIPELEEELLDHMGHGEAFEIDPDQCEWRWRRMTSVNVNE